MLLGAAALVAGAGCATRQSESGAQGSVVLHADAEGKIWFNGDPYPVNRVAAALQAARVASNQAIRIHIPDRRDRARIVRITSAMRTAGFSRFFFVSEQHADSSVVGPGRTGAAALAPTDPFAETGSP